MNGNSSSWTCISDETIRSMKRTKTCGAFDAFEFRELLGRGEMSTGVRKVCFQGDCNSFAAKIFEWGSSDEMKHHQKAFAWEVFLTKFSGQNEFGPRVI